MITTTADFAALAARLIAQARALAEARPRNAPEHWRDARRLWPLFAKDEPWK